MKLLTLFLPVSAAVPLQASPSRLNGHGCSDIRYPPPSVRSPPRGGYQGHNFGLWTPPSPEHLYGTYYMTHTSYSQQQSSFLNLRIERYPIYPNGDDIPAGSQVEIGSWSTCTDVESVTCRDPDAISTVFGYNIPMGAQGPTDKKYAAAWRYNASGRLEGTFNDLYAILAWGVDSKGYAFFAQYETGPNPVPQHSKTQTDGITIASRNEKGIDQTTYICLSSSLKRLAEELGDKELSDIVSNLRPFQSDGRRDGQGPVECDESCTSNTNVEL